MSIPMCCPWIDMRRTNLKTPVGITALVTFSIGLVVLVESTYAYSLSDVEEPPASRLTYVGKMVHNGLPMEVLQFVSDFSVSELKAFYKQSWKDVAKRGDGLPSYIEKHVGEWTILSKIEASSNVVVQIKESSERVAEGFISVSDIEQRKETGPWVSDFPSIQGSSLVSSTESDENGRRAYTLILINEHSLAENNDFYQLEMDAQGWRISRQGESGNVFMMHYLKDNWRCDMAMSEAEDGKSVIIVNLVELNGE